MGDFEYKVSVIVPVYNVEKYLRDCLDSLLAQTMDHEQMEVLLINDGSTDNSLDICNEYAEIFPCFKVFSKENEGLSATRNYGITHAKGKYLMYLDSDDKIISETIKEVTDFFDTIYDEVDLVTYRLQTYKKGEKMPLHFRYKYLKKSGIYDINKYPYLCQTTINICTKNILEENILFDTTPNFRHEDQAYNNYILATKGKIGYCSKGEYQYIRNDESIMATYMFPLYIFETTMNYYERLFSSFDQVPIYYQSMFVHDISWKLKDSVLFPYHYDNEMYKKAIKRLTSLIDKVEDSVFLTHPSTDAFHRHFFLNMKSDSKLATIVASSGSIVVLKKGKQLLSISKFELIMHKIRVRNKQLQMRAFLKTPLYSYLTDHAKIYAIENDDYERKNQLDVDFSVHSYYKSKDFTNKFYNFTYHCDTRKVISVKFVIEVDGFIYQTKFWCMPVAVFSNSEPKKIEAYVRDDVKITLENNQLFFQQLTRVETKNFELQQTEQFKKETLIYTMRLAALKYREMHRVWLYYDLYTVRKDNGYFQFINDFCHKDGIERYYIYNRNLEDIKDEFTEEQKRYLVKFGSRKHILLYLSAEKILTAFFGYSPISPINNEKEEANYTDIIKFEVIYLQHGVLHANLKIFNHAERSRADKIVVSSYFEKDNLIQNYGYEEQEIIPTGMARYDFIDKSVPAKNRILFAPSWRKYLTNEISNSKWDFSENKILNSDYYKNFCTFLSDTHLAKILEEKNLFLDVKLHPIIKDAKSLFKIESSQINIVLDEVNIEDYKLFITDFSSYVFDFAYLSRPILYFVPDMEQFKAGMNHYRELDLPWNEAFGILTIDSPNAVKEVIKIINNNFIPDPIFKQRMDDFFLPLNKCRENLYEYLYTCNT